MIFDNADKKIFDRIEILEKKVLELEEKVKKYDSYEGIDARLVSTNYLMHKLGLSRATVERYRTNGMPFKRIGNSVRFEYKEAVEWMENNLK